MRETFGCINNYLLLKENLNLYELLLFIEIVLHNILNSINNFYQISWYEFITIKVSRFYSSIIFNFSLHRTHSLLRVRKTESYFLNLPAHHQKLLAKYKEHLQEVKRCIENNDQIIKLIIKDVAHIFENVCPSTAQIDSVRDYLPLFIYIFNTNL